MKVPRYFVFSFLFFCLEPTVTKNTWMRTTSIIVMVIFPKVLFWKLLDHGYVQSFINNYEAHLKRHLRETLHLRILRKCINLRANWLWINIRAKHTFNKILSWLNTMKQKLTKVPGKYSFAQKSKPVLWRTLHQNRRWHFTFLYTSFLSNKSSF